MTSAFRRLACAALLLLGTAACDPAALRSERAATAPATAVLAAPPPDWHAHLGDRVRIAAPLTVSGVDRLAEDDALVASFGGRLYAPTEIAAPGADAARIAAGNARRRLLLALPADLDPAWRSGSTLTGVEGVVERHDGDIRLRLDAPPRVRPAPRPPAPTVAGDVRLASLNLENLFNGDGRGGGFPTPRGARTPDDHARQLGRLVATLRALDPDIAALMELENDGDGPESSLAQLVVALDGAESGDANGGRWRYVRGCPAPCRGNRGPGRDEIRVGLIYRADRVEPVGAPATLTGGPFAGRSRVPLAQAFRAGRGPAFTVAAVHFKSKGCGEAAGRDLNQRDGQACWNATRSESAARLDRWFDSDPTRSGSELVAILGDFNAYAREDPIRRLIDAGWRDALSAATDRPYNYVYDAQAGRLDHALLSPALAARLAGAAVWHSNADEPGNVGDHADNTPASFAPWRSSDHDPLLVGLRLRTP